MKTLLPLGALCACALLLSGCAIDREVTPTGRDRVRVRGGTNTAVDITAEGRAADIVAGNLAAVPTPPADWNDDTRKAGRTGVIDPGYNGGGASYIRVIVGENQTKGLGILGASIVGYAGAQAWEAASLAKTASDKATALAAGKEGTARLISDNTTKVKLAEIAAGEAPPAAVVVKP